MKITRQTLPILPGINPSSKVNEKYIKEGFDNIIANAGKYWAWLNGDVGAYDLPLILQDKILNQRFTMSTGHYEMCLTKVMMEFIIALLGWEMLYAHGFLEGGGGPDYLRSCKNNHYAWDFIQLVLRALYLEFAKQYLLENLRKNNTERSVKGFIAFLDDPTRTDVTFKNLVSFLKLYDAYDLLRRSIRDKNGHGNYFAYNASRKKFGPFLFMTNHPQYCRLSLWDQISQDFRIPEVVQKFAEENLSIEGQGPDYMEEQSIKELKQAATTSGTKGLVAAGKEMIIYT